MEKFKIENFEKDSERVFPKFRSLDTQEIDCIVNRLRTTLAINLKENLKLTVEIDRRQSILNQFNMHSVDITFSDILIKLNIHSSELVYINWYRYDNIDEMNLKDLVMHFNDIWYPCSDDIDIFDETCKWIVSINHEGYVKFLK